MQRPDLSQGTEAVPEKQSRHIKGEAGGGRLEERPELVGGRPQPQTPQGASGQSMGAELVSGQGGSRGATKETWLGMGAGAAFQ